jgi:peptide/nickel transport system permease protein
MAVSQALSVDLAHESPGARAWRRLFKRRSAVFGLVVIVLFILMAVLAPLIAPYDPTQQGWTSIRKPPSLQHWFGTDESGRDLFSRVIFGARASLLAGVVSISIALGLGVPIGLLAGYGGKWIDAVIGRITDAMLACPFLILAIALAAFLGPSLQNAMIAIGVIYVPPFARIVRASVLSLREREFVDAARGLGAGAGRVVLRHVLPNCLSPAIVQASLGMGYAILVEAALSFLGLGVQPPQASWGSMLAEGRSFLDRAPWFATFPGLAIFVTVLGLNTVGDRLREALDPRLRHL